MIDIFVNKNYHKYEGKIKWLAGRHINLFSSGKNNDELICKFNIIQICLLQCSILFIHEAETSHNKSIFMIM